VSARCGDIPSCVAEALHALPRAATFDRPGVVTAAVRTARRAREAAKRVNAVSRREAASSKRAVRSASESAEAVRRESVPSSEERRLFRSRQRIRPDRKIRTPPYVRAKKRKINDSQTAGAMGGNASNHA